MRKRNELIEFHAVWGGIDYTKFEGGVYSSEWFWAKPLGLCENVVVGAGSFDAYQGAFGSGINPYLLCKVMGTSTTDIIIVPADDT